MFLSPWQDPASQLSWFNYVVCDPAASEPGEFEQEGRDAPYIWALNRNTRLTWDALRPAVEAALTTTPALWREHLWPANTNAFYLLPGGQLARGNASLPRWSCPNVPVPRPHTQEVLRPSCAWLLLRDAQLDTAPLCLFAGHLQARRVVAAACHPSAGRGATAEWLSPPRH